MSSQEQQIIQRCYEKTLMKWNKSPRVSAARSAGMTPRGSAGMTPATTLAADPKIRALVDQLSATFANPIFDRTPSSVAAASVDRLPV